MLLLLTKSLLLWVVRSSYTISQLNSEFSLTTNSQVHTRQVPQKQTVGHILSSLCFSYKNQTCVYWLTFKVYISLTYYCGTYIHTYTYLCVYTKWICVRVPILCAFLLYLMLPLFLCPCASFTRVDFSWYLFHCFNANEMKREKTGFTGTYNSQYPL